MFTKLENITVCATWEVENLKLAYIQLVTVFSTNKHPAKNARTRTQSSTHEARKMGVRIYIEHYGRGRKFEVTVFSGVSFAPMIWPGNRGFVYGYSN